jgi:thiamine biosynthesis lipoprotein
MTSFHTWGMSGTVATQHPKDNDHAHERIQFWIAAFNASINRFDADSELSAINSSGGGTFTVSPLLEAALLSARRCGDLTQDLCDPTVLSALEQLGYDRDYDEIATCDLRRSSTSSPAPGPGSWSVNTESHTVRIDAGVRLDLGASAKALFADLVVNELSELGGALVEIGGDVSLRGEGPDGPWVVGVATSLAISGTEPRISMGDGGIATSSRVTRTWSLNGQLVNHIIDPRTGSCANGSYVVASVAGPDCVDANALATAALLWGDDAGFFIAEAGAAGRLVHANGDVDFVGGWTREESL